MGDLQADAGTHEKRKSDGASVGFLITEVDTETNVEASPAAAASSTSPAADKALAIATPSSSQARVDSTASLPLISVYRVQDTEVPIEAIGDQSMSAPLPQNINMEHVMTNIKQNLDFKGFSDNARNTWFKDFKSPPSRAVISDTFWFCICWYFKTGQHNNLENALFDRISANFVALFSSVPAARKDFFFRCYADAVAQAVLYSMFLAYPKSRVHFTEKFRKDLIIRISHWTTGVCPEFVDASHWKLNLGGGDVLQSTTSQHFSRGHLGDSSRAGTGSASQTLLNADSLTGRRTSLAHRAPRPPRTLRYSPLVAHFLKSRKYSSVNLVRETRMSMTQAEERARLMDMKHAMLLERATAARQNCDLKVAEYNDLCAESRRQERQRQREAQTAKKRLEIRRKEVLRSDPHEYANYLVSLHLLQQGLGQGA